MAKTVTIYKGLPASGKSTHARGVVDKSQGSTKRINKDDLRAMLDNSNWSKKNEKFVLRVRNWLIKQALAEGKHVLIDDPNLHESHEQDIRELVKTWNRENQDNVVVKIEDSFLEVTVEECIKRDLKRDASVGEKVIRDMYRRYLRPKDEKAFGREYNKPWEQWAKDKPMAVVCDIDGTIALINDRSPYDTAKCKQDTPNPVIIQLVKQEFERQDQIILVSGRSDEFRQQTVEWLADNRVYYDQLLMRKQGDVRKDSIVKTEIYEQDIEPHFNVRYVLDDRNQTVEAWRKLGLICLQVAPGDF